MTLIEAYGFTLEKIEELKDAGIEVIMKPSNCRNNKELVEKYNHTERMPPDKWFHVTLKMVNKSQATKVHEVVNYLGMCGIVFDTGGWINYRDWELDWSFQYTGKEDEDRRDARDEVEDRIPDMGNE